MQAPHFTHFAASMTKGFLIWPEMAPAGQMREHLLQPLHLSAIMTKRFRALQTPAGHFLSRTWATYSSLKYLMVLTTGDAAV